MVTNVAVVGLGRMGLPIAQALQQAGHQVIVHDQLAAARDRARAADLTVRDTLAELRGADVCLLSLPNPAVVADVATSFHDSATVVIDTSTTDPEVSRSLAKTLEGRFVDAPILGRPHRVGHWTIPVGGHAETVAIAEPLLEVLADRVVRVGPAGAGATVKVINNLMLSVINSATAEAIALAQASEVDVDQFVRVLSESNAASISGLFIESAPRMATGDFEPVFTVELMRKDAGLGMALADRAGLNLPLAQCSTQLLDAALDNGLADRDASAVIEALSHTTATHPAEPLPLEDHHG